MLTVPAQIRIPLDDLAFELLPAHVVVAINAVAVERWRRPTMSAHHGKAVAVREAPAQRLLPVVVFGETVFFPYRPPVPLIVSIGEGKSYTAMQTAMHGDGEVLLVFVPEAELDGFRSSMAQPLPNVGVIARITELSEQPGAWHRIRVEGLSRATTIARVAHAPFYSALCTPHHDPGTAAAQNDELQQIKTWVLAYARQNMREDTEHWLPFVNNIRQPGLLADVCASGPMFSFSERLALLQILDPVERLRTVKLKLGI